MRKTTKIWLITAASLILIGCIIFGGIMGVLRWDFTKLSAGTYETNQYEINEKFNNISVETDTADLIFALSDDGKCRVECYEERKAKHFVSVENDALVIRIDNKKSWYDYIGFHFGSPKITVYLPNAEYTALFINKSVGNIKLPKDFKFDNVDISLSTGNVDSFASASGLIKIKTSTGNISVKDTSVGALDLSASTGGITISNVTCEGDVKINTSTGKTNLSHHECRNLSSSGKTGNISLNHVIAAEKLSIKRTTGNVRLDDSDAAEIFVETSTGKVTGSLLTDKVFITNTDTGRVDVPKSVTGGRCEISTRTGNIKITIK